MRHLLLREMWALLCVTITAVLPMVAQGQSTNSIKLTVEMDRVANRAVLSATGVTNANKVYQLEASETLTNWTIMGRFVGGLAPYPDLTDRERSKYYRMVEMVDSTAADWSNQLLAREPNSKFILLLTEPDRVYFHPPYIYHYQFANRELPGIPSATPELFDAAVLYPSRQQAVIGGLNFYLDETVYGVEFVGLEPFEPAKLVEYFKTVTARVRIPGAEPFLIPPPQQWAQILTNLGYFASNGVPVRELTEFVTNNAAHSEGWSIGILKYVPAAELEAAIVSGVITPDTILMTDAAPRELPRIAGFISLFPSSPNSHVVLRLQGAELPYLDLPAAQRADVTNMIGKTVLFSTKREPPRSYSSAPPHYPPSWKSAFRLHAMDSLPESIREVIEDRKTNATVRLQPMERFGSYSTNADILGPQNTRHFGSKAANYGILRRTIPNQSPRAIALSFDLWMDFMAQTMPGGRTLAEEIGTRLGAIETNALNAPVKLKEMRDLIEDVAQFTPQQIQAITNALSIFDPQRKIRFRSSSNAEDLPTFSAAGLYESHSGCLLDDLTPGSADECACDPQDDKRRSVFRAIRKVFASFYNEPAFRERRQYGLNETETGMAILVHHSFPDEIELANGIATVEFASPDRIRTCSLVTQRGALSVANPEGHELPEWYEWAAIDGPLWPSSWIPSTVRPPGTPVFQFPDEYNRLHGLFELIGRGYPWDEVPGVSRLNFEFKKTPEGLIVKQVRPVHSSTGQVATIVLPQKVVLHTFQGGETPATLEGSHRLKSIWEFESNAWNPADSRTNLSLFDRARVIHLSNGRIVTNEVHFVSAGRTNNQHQLYRYWTAIGTETLAAPHLFRGSDPETEFKLTIYYPKTVPSNVPFIYPSDLVMIAERPGIAGVAELNVAMGLPGGENRVIYATNGVGIETVYTLVVTPVHPLVGIGPTWNLGNWKETVITGLTEEPIILRGYFSQTYAPSRHNFVEHFLFEPALEPGLSPELLEELRAADISRIQFKHNQFVIDPSSGQTRVISKFELIGFDGSVRPAVGRLGAMETAPQ